MDNRLLTTRRRTVVALCLTALVLALTIRHRIYSGQTQSTWLVGDHLLRGWPLVSVNLVLYGYLCWLGFWFVRGTEGRERFFIIGWFADILLWPLKVVKPQWSSAMDNIGLAGLATALFAALSFLLREFDSAADRHTT